MAFFTTRWTLIDAAKRGDAAALDTLLERYRAPVLAYLRRCGLSDADAEDVCQEVFLALYRKVLPGVDGGRGQFRSLLLVLTRNTFLQRARKQRALRRGGGQVPVPLEEELTPALAPESAFDQEWLRSLLARALTRLEREHPNYHAALCGALLDERSYAEIAESLGATVTSVRNGVHRGRQKVLGYLRVLVGEYSADPREHETEIRLLNGLLQG
jgi:RNA polymerase sigma-70 factor (ECF subfamily)